MTTPPLETTVPVVAPTPEETRAISNPYSDELIRKLAQFIQKSGQLGFDPTTLKKGIIIAIDVTGSPPTVSIQISGDTTTTVASVRMLNNYSPVVGHTVLIVQQGADIVILGHIADLGGKTAANGAGGWNLATLSAGSHNGNSSGNVYYRRILDHGSWKMQWRGGWAVSGTFMINTGQALAAEYRPAETRPVLAARHFASGPVACHMVFTSDGRVEMQGGTQASSTGTVSGDIGFVDPADSTSVADTSHNHLGDSGGVTGVTSITHNHSIVGGHDHSFFGGSHTHPVTSPTWVSLHGVEYFL